MNQNNPIKKAVFPVAGFGTRFLPATKASPKEMLPVVDKPLIQYAVEEAIEAGMTEMIFITGRGNKRAIEDHFDRSYEIENELESRNKEVLLNLVRNIKPSHIHFCYVRQPEALGLGHAVSCAEFLVGNNPFAVVLADDLLVGETPILKQMIDVFGNSKNADENENSVIAVEKIKAVESLSYGVIDGKKKNNRIIHLSHIVEKPLAENAPRIDDCMFGVVGRYILKPRIFHHLRHAKPGAGGEIQLTDAIQALLKEETVLGYSYQGHRYDCGDKLGYLKANIELGLQHIEVKEGLLHYLKVKNFNK